MTFWRRCGEIATTFFAKAGDHGPTESRARRTPGTSFAPPRRDRRRCGASNVELAPEQIVDRAGVGLAARRLHHLAHEPTDHCGLRLGLRDLVGVAGHDL